jgi:uncharacterized LabA/DUF88 family protein
MIDGWFMRKRIYHLGSFLYNGSNIRDYCKKHLRVGDEIYRIYYYDTQPLEGKGNNPLTNSLIDFGKTNVAKNQRELLDSLKCTPNVALRLGKTVWRNKSWKLNNEKLKNLIKGKISVNDLSEGDFQPLIEQKTVDMKIGLDLALIATKKLADVLILISGDSDMVPALKLARTEGMLVGLDPLKNNINPDLAEHVDFVSTKLGDYKKTENH